MLYVDAVTVMHVLLFVLHVCMLRKRVRVRDENAGMGDVGSVVVVTAGHVGGTRGLGIVPSALDVIVMSVELVECVKCVCAWLVEA